MQPNDLLDVMVQEKKRYNLLNEVFDLSVQLADAADRGDTVAVQMLVAMRQDPINKLEDVEQALAEKQGSLEAADAQRLAALLKGGEPQNAEEARLAVQVDNSRKMLKKTVELDERINRKIAGADSIYAG